MAEKQCSRCKEIKELKKFQESFNNAGGYDINDPKRYKATCKTCYGKVERYKLKLDIYDNYGQKCQCCGESDIRFLSLDHVNSDGNIHRELLNEQQIYREARREGYPVNKYRLLCMNCNWARAYFGGECPHKSKISNDVHINNLREFVEPRGFKDRVANTSNLPLARLNNGIMSEADKKLFEITLKLAKELAAKGLEASHS